MPQSHQQPQDQRHLELASADRLTLEAPALARASWLATRVRHVVVAIANAEGPDTVAGRRYGDPRESRIARGGKAGRCGFSGAIET